MVVILLVTKLRDLVETFTFLKYKYEENFISNVEIGAGFPAVRENLENLEKLSNFKKIREFLEKSGKFKK